MKRHGKHIFHRACIQKAFAAVYLSVSAQALAPVLDMDKICNVLLDGKATPDLAASSIGSVKSRAGDEYIVAATDPTVAKATVTLKPKAGLRARDLDVKLEFLKGTSVPPTFASFCKDHWLIAEPPMDHSGPWQYACYRQTSDYITTITIIAQLTGRAEKQESHLLTLLFERVSSQ